MSATFVQRYAAPPTPTELAERAGLPLERIVKLDANESPWGPTPAARVALRALAGADGASVGSVARYPDATGGELRQALSRYSGVAPEGIVIGNGSDEIIQLLAEALLEPGDEVIVSEPTFSVYALIARRRGARVVDVPRDGEWTTPADALLAAMNARTRLVFLCAPNNPTGTSLDRTTLDAALTRARALATENDGAGPVIVVDEAYYEVGAFADDARAWTAAPLVAPESGRLVVLRTFSKLFGLAGLRVGYALCDAALAERLRALKAPYNANLAGQLAALASLGDVDWLRARARELVAGRERLARQLSAGLGLRVWPSAANFVLVDVAGEVSDALERERRGAAIWQALLDQGVMTRHLGGPRLAGSLRMSVGLPEQMDALLMALARALAVEEG